ncbi:ABC transporter permease [Oleomonas cavernae]|uniref:ABC transporter permease n=1 Tax=Oleomonas cavernae TaxID=2320859 RepID=A0A418WTC8_9PROT|nr:ABC transporter permease [Oleomonas cavernae]RJF94419.1 ABC transporter permease [Oleomonas cavernae]
MGSEVTATPQTTASRGDTVASRALLRQLRRAERRRQWGAFALVAPLVLFLIVAMVLPIGDMLRRAVDDPEIADVLPQVTRAFDDWTDHGQLPPDSVFAALAADMASARAAGTLPIAARRLNYAVDGGRSLLVNSARRLPETAPNWRDTLIAADPRWGELDVWAALYQARGPLTDFFLLAAIDMQRDAQGDLTATPADRAIYRDVLARTFEIAGAVTLLCLLLGFPVAYLLANLPPRRSNLLMILVLLPFWTSLLVRTAAWVVLLQENGLVNQVMMMLGVTEAPVRLVYNRIGVYIAMTHVLLPFMILPIYSVMRGISPVYRKAALSLGATPTTAFLRVYLPQTLPGLAAGVLLVFIMALGYYITPALIGGAGDQMVSYFIAFYTTDTVNWGMAAALGAVLLSATLLLYWVYNRLVGGGVRLG